MSLFTHTHTLLQNWLLQLWGAENEVKYWLANTRFWKPSWFFFQIKKKNQNPSFVSKLLKIRISKCPFSLLGGKFEKHMAWVTLTSYREQVKQALEVTSNRLTGLNGDLRWGKRCRRAESKLKPWLKPWILDSEEPFDPHSCHIAHRSRWT